MTQMRVLEMALHGVLAHAATGPVEEDYLKPLEAFFFDVFEQAHAVTRDTQALWAKAERAERRATPWRVPVGDLSQSPAQEDTP
jgi:hypothetical protein